MLLFKKRFWDGLVSGAVTLTFRRWEKPHVRVGGRYRCHPIGVLVVDRIEHVPAGRISNADAKRAGFASREELAAYLAELGPLDDATPVWRIELHHGGEADHVEAALDADLTPKDVETIQKRLARLDGKQPWTQETLALIARQPHVVAKKLAAKLGRETLPFKADVRKLKRMGLTQSFEVGYDLTPRGRAYLEGAKKLARKRTRK